MPSDRFVTRGWVKFPHDAGLAAWVAVARPAALAAVKDLGNAKWLRCGGTWFVGVNALNNDSTGAVDASGPLRGPAISFLKDQDLPTNHWDRAQISVIYPGYPRPGTGESAAAFRFRRDRDAAHVDGLHAIGTARRRMLREPHAFILGIPLTDTSAKASPLVVWEGSHILMRRALSRVLAPCSPDIWPQIDLTDAYTAARREAFETCRRVEIHARPGEAYVLHRLALHGVAPWVKGAKAPPEGRMIAYFRPELPATGDWLN